MQSDEILEEAGAAATYFPGLASITGSAVATLFLSHLLLMRKAGVDSEGWVCGLAEDIRQRTGLTIQEQNEARRQLRGNALVEEKQGIASSVCWRVDPEKLKRKIEVAGARRSAVSPKAAEAVIDDSILSIDMIPDLVKGTPYDALDLRALEGFASVYGLPKVLRTIDVLVAIHQSKPETIANPTSTLTRALMKGVTPPENFFSALGQLKISKKQRIDSAVGPKPAPASQPKTEVEEKKPKPVPDLGLLP